MVDPTLPPSASTARRCGLLQVCMSQIHTQTAGFAGTNPWLCARFGGNCPDSSHGILIFLGQMLALFPAARVHEDEEKKKAFIS